MVWVITGLSSPFGQNNYNINTKTDNTININTKTLIITLLGNPDGLDI